MIIISCNLVKTIRFISTMLVCMVHIRILCFDPITCNGQMTFELRKVNVQGHGPADHDPNMRTGHLILSNYEFWGVGTKSPFSD